MQTDAVFSPSEDDVKLKTVDGAAVLHEGVICYWRRKRCPVTGTIVRTIEVPVDVMTQFHTQPPVSEMTKSRRK